MMPKLIPLASKRIYGSLMVYHLSFIILWVCLFCFVIFFFFFLFIFFFFLQKCCTLGDLHSKTRMHYRHLPYDSCIIMLKHKA